MQSSVQQDNHDQRSELPEVFLSVIIPAYNEENRIGRTLDSLIDYFGNSDYSVELIVVDDGSMDGTANIVKQAFGNPRVRGDQRKRGMGGRTLSHSKLGVLENARLISYIPNRGKGSAVRRGILASKGEYTVFMDADLSTPVEEIESALRYLSDGYDIVIGSRALPESEILQHQPFYRERAAWIFKHLYQVIVGMNGFQDTQCGFKVFNGDVARYIFGLQQVDGFMFDIETLYIARKLKCRVKEMPVRWRNSPESRLRIIEDTARMFKDLVLIRFNHRKLKGT